MIDVAAAADGNVIRQQLQRNGQGDRRQQWSSGRNCNDDVVAAIENLVLAARADGSTPSVEISPTDDPSHVARVTLSSGSPRVSPLYHQIAQRHTNRYPYSDRAVDRQALEAMSALALPDVRIVWVTDRERRHQFGELLIAATQEIIDDPAQLESDHQWFRHRWDDIQARRDGITLAISTSGEAPAIAGLLREGLDALLPEDAAAWMQAAREARAEWRRDGVPMEQRRPRLLEALNRLYATRENTTDARHLVGAGASARSEMKES